MKPTAFLLFSLVLVVPANAAPSLLRAPDARERALLLGAVRYPEFNLTFEAGFWPHSTFATQIPGVDPVRFGRLEKAVADGSAAPHELKEYAGHLRQQNKLIEARDAYNKAFNAYALLLPVARDPVPAYIAQAEIRERLGQYAEAVALFLKALSLREAQPRVWQQLGYVYLQAGDFNRAYAAFQQAIRLEPDEPDYYHDVQILYRARLYALGPVALEREIKAGNFGKLYTLEWINKAVALSRNAFKYQVLQRFTLLEMVFLRLTTGYGLPVFRSGTIPLLEGERALLQESERFLRDILPGGRVDRSTTARFLAINLLCLGKMPEAITLLRMEAARNPQDNQLIDGLYAVLFGIGDDFRGVADAIVARVRTSPRVRDHLLHGKILMRAGKLEEADKAVAAALAMDAGDSDALLAKASLLTRQGKLEEALAALAPLDGPRMQSPAALLARARLAIVLGKSDAAYQALDTLFKTAPEHPEGRQLFREWFGIN